MLKDNQNAIKYYVKARDSYNFILRGNTSFSSQVIADLQDDLATVNQNLLDCQKTLDCLQETRAI